MVFASPAPTVAENPENNRQGLSDRLRRINVQPEIAAVDTFVNQISLDRSIYRRCRMRSWHPRLSSQWESTTAANATLSHRRRLGLSPGQIYLVFIMQI